MQETKLHTQCLVCESKNIHPMKGYESFQLGKCSDCGFVFMLRIPTIQELKDYYAVYFYDKEQYLSPLTISSYNKLLDQFEPYRKTGNLIDVGCGQGWFLDAAKKRGWNVYGTEYSEVAVQKCSARGINMHQGALNPADFAGIEFDIIVSFEVFEHINNPNEEFQNMYQLLRKGGLLYFTTPNFNYYLRYQMKAQFSIIMYPEHLSYYTPKTINTALTRNNFKKIKTLTTGISITRLQQSLGKVTKDEIVTKDASDEKLRQMLNSNIFMKLLKRTANKLLTLTGLGLSLKGYYTK